MNGIDYTNDPRAVLIHFNPNHDKLGRFAKSRFGGSKKLDKSANMTYNKNEESNTIDKERLKKCAKIGAGVVATSLLVAGGIYLAKSGKLESLIDNRSVDDAINMIKDEPIVNLGGGTGDTVSNAIKNTGKSPQNLDLKMISNINGPGLVETERRYNCAHTSMAYILNSMFGMNVTAKPFSGVDENSGFVGAIDSNSKIIKFGRDINIFRAVFDGLEYKKCDTSKDTLSKVLSAQPQGTGIIRIIHKSGGHYINYEKDKNGVISIIDGQTGEVVWGLDGLKFLEQKGYIPADIIDATKAVLKNDENAVKVLKAMVE